MLNLHLLECTVKGYDHISDLLLAKYWVITGCKYYNCSSLSSVNIGNGIKSLGERAFRECYALTSFYCYATNPPKHGGYVFEVFGKKTTLYVPIRCGDKYKSSDWGYYFKNIKEME